MVLLRSVVLQLRVWPHSQSAPFIAGKGADVDLRGACLGLFARGGESEGG